jgi:hypothetical protein
MGVCTKDYTKYTNTLRGQNAELFRAKYRGGKKKHWVLKG